MSNRIISKPEIAKKEVLQPQDNSCKFCKIVRGEIESRIVFEDSGFLGFLDHKPLFPGHTLMVPKNHHETLSDIPTEIIYDLFLNVQLMTRAVERGVQAEGSFVA